MKFENQLQQLMEQHKNLSTVFTPQRLPAEIQSAEYTTEQLLKAEQQKLEQLTKLLDGLSHTQNAEMHMDTCEKAPWIPQTDFSNFEVFILQNFTKNQLIFFYILFHCSNLTCYQLYCQQMLVNKYYYKPKSNYSVPRIWKFIKPFI